MSRFIKDKEKTTTSRFVRPSNESQGSRFAKESDKPKTELDLDALVKRFNIEKPAPPKLSFLQRLGAGLGAFETGNAVATGLEKKSVGAGVGSYFTGIAKGLGSAITGNDYGQTEKKSYKDIAEKYGVKNGIAKFGLGFVGDVLLDPTTYFGGAIAKGAIKGSKLAANTTLKTIGKAAPDVEKGLRIAGQGAKDALGKGFVFGYGTSKGLREKALTITGKLDNAKAGIVESNIARLGTGTLSPSQQQELVEKMYAGKRAEFATGRATDAGRAAAQKAAQSTDPLVQKTIQEQSARSAKLAKQSGIEDPFAVYYPGLRKENLSKFFETSKKFRVGNEGWRKEFKDLLGDDEIIKNPAEAFAKREFEVVKDNIVRSELNSVVKEYGKPLTAFKNADEAAKAGFRVVREKGAFGKEVGYLSEVDKKFLDDLISPEFGTIDAIARYTGFDAITSLFKRSVTGLFPSFHVRNYVSGLIQNYEVLGAKALAPKNVALGHKLAWSMSTGKSLGKQTVKIGTKDYSLNKVLEPFAKRFGGSSQYIKDIADATSQKAITKVKSLNPLSTEAWHFRKARAVGGFIENQQKAVAYITALRDGKTVKQALAMAEEAGFDYRALTGFESKILRRIIPFYSFARKNIELQGKTLAKNPQRIANVMKLARNASGMTTEEQSQLPDYAQEKFNLKVGDNYSIGLGTPIEALGDLFGRAKSGKSGSDDTIRKWLSMANPLIKFKLERAVNRDFFRDRPLDEVVEAGEYSKAPQWVKDFLKAREVTETKNGKTVKKVYADPRRLQLLRNLPTTRGVGYVSAIADDRSNLSKILFAFTGIKPKQIDFETVKFFKEDAQKKELEKLLIQSGIMKEFTKTYIPKNQK